MKKSIHVCIIILFLLCSELHAAPEIDATKALITLLKINHLKPSITTEDGYDIVKFKITANTYGDLDMICILKEKDGFVCVSMYAYNFIALNKQRKHDINVLSEVNRLNSKFSFIKFTVDTDNNRINVSTTAIISNPKGDNGVQCMMYLDAYLDGLISACDETYPILMKTVWH